MKINYKKELESAAKTMILVHDPTTLIKMIARTIVNKARVHHAGILLHDKEKDSYILTVSRGTAGLKIPSGFARMDSDNPLISFFKKRFDKQVLDDGVFIYGEAKKIANKRKIDPQVKKVLKGALYQMEIFEAVVCVPSYYRDELLGLLLLGKKKSGKEFAQDELDFFVALASDVAMAIQNALLFKELTSELDKKQRLFIHTTIALAAAIDAKDHYTHGHTARVTRISLDIAKEISLRNNHRFDDKFLEDLHVASLLHDIGKIGIPESILNKNDKLTPEEICKIKQHPTVGTTILQPIRELDRAILGVKYHHERFDGGGYPEGLKGEEIPIIAAIISAADAFDAMTSDRPYRKALTTKQAIDEIKQGKGKQFHPEVAEALISLHHKNQL